MQKNIILLFMLMTFSISCSANNSENLPDPPKEQEKTWATASEINQRLGKGINIGNTFEAMPSWQSSFDAEDIKRIADLRFTHIRLPIRWERDDRSLSVSPYTIRPEFFNTIRSVVDEALKNKLHIIINMHHHDALYANPNDQKERFLAQWQQISDYFKNYSDSLLFEIMNEPHDNLSSSLWNIFSKEALQVIRTTNPKRCVLLGTAEWGGIGGLKSLEIPNDPHLILTIHYYNPFQFTHQGAEWSEGSDAWLGTEWKDTEYERKTIWEDFKLVKHISEEKNIPIHIGEFGAYSKADLKSRILWTQYLARWFEQQSFSWAYWEWNSGFGIYDPKSGTYNTGLVDALIKNPMPESHQTTIISLYSSNFANGNNDGWNLYNNDVSASSSFKIAGDKVVFTINKPGTENWHIQFIKGGFNMDREKSYLVRFNAYLPNSDSKTINFNVSKASDPWTSYIDKAFLIDKNDTKYEFVFTPSESDSQARMVFSMGNSGTSEMVLYAIELGEVVKE